MASRTLRLNMPQWQGGDEPAYRFGAELLRWLAPEHDGPEETVFVPEPNGRAPEIDHGIKARTVLLSQARAARAAIERHDPDRIVTLGGDCLVDLAPMAYLNRKYPALGVLWIDAHPDVMSAAEFSHAHAHVLGMLLGRGDEAFTAEVPKKLTVSRVMSAGMSAWTDAEGAAPQRAWTADLWAKIRDESAGAYVAFLESEGDDRTRAAYPDRTYARLAAIKQIYDPENFFRRNQNIAPRG